MFQLCESLAGGRKALHICPKLFLQGPSVVPDFQCPNNLTLIFELRLAACLESMPLLSWKTPRKIRAVTFHAFVSDCPVCFRTFNRIGHEEQSITMPLTRPKRRAGRDPDGWWSLHSVLRSLIRQDCRQLSFAAVQSFYPF